MPRILPPKILERSSVTKLLMKEDVHICFFTKGQNFLTPLKIKRIFASPTVGHIIGSQ